MVMKQAIEVVAENNHSVIWEMSQGNTPYSVTGRTYVMKIQDEAATTTVTMTCAVQLAPNDHLVECIGDLSGLNPDTDYLYYLSEDGNLLISGIARVLKGMP